MSPQLSVSPNPKVAFEIIYQDEDFVAVHKPAGIVTQPGIKNQYNTLLNGAFAHWGKRLQNLGKKRDFGLLHRLDKGTSGIVLIALSVKGYEGLRTLFEKRSIQKKYWAIIAGTVKPRMGLCSIPIAERRVQGKKQAILVNSFSSNHRHNKVSSKLNAQRPKSLKGQKAVTQYETLTSSRSQHGVSSLISCDLLTGRLHQIRVHMKSLGSFVLGDFDYGGKNNLNLLVKSMGRDHLALHAGLVSFKHPLTQQELVIQTPPPEWFLTMMTELNLKIPPKLADFSLKT